jgi:hypothetical protein
MVDLVEKLSSNIRKHEKREQTFESAPCCYLILSDVFYYHMWLYQNIASSKDFSFK